MIDAAPLPEGNGYVLPPAVRDAYSIKIAPGVMSVMAQFMEPEIPYESNPIGKVLDVNELLARKAGTAEFLRVLLDPQLRKIRIDKAVSDAKRAP